MAECTPGADFHISSRQDFCHIPVLLQETIDLLKAGGGHRFIDGTLGGGGHCEALMEALPESEVIGIDRDKSALQATCGRLSGKFGSRFHGWHGCFSGMEEAAASRGWDKVDGILLDIGVSSPQIDTPERGFSFRYDAPLDMRMDTSSGEPTAADLLNSLSEKELSDIFFKWGEERYSRQVARRIVERREKSPWNRTGELAQLLENVIGRSHQHGLPPATRVFQALRIAVNHEMDELESALSAAERLLSARGRLAVISFHSLEDRCVKHFLQYAALTCICPPGMPCTCHKKATFEILTRKPVTASEDELKRNPRSSCAKLRCGMRTPE